MITQNDNRKKIPYARPVPRSFAAAWESKKEGAPRRYSRSPSPRRFDDPWHGDIPPPRHHRPSEDDYHAIDDRRPPPDHDRPPPAVEERLPPPFDPPLPGGPPHKDQGPLDYDQNHYPEGPNIPDPVRGHGDDSYVDQTQMDVEPYQEYGIENNHERSFPPSGRGDFAPFRGRPAPPGQGPPGRRDWNSRMSEENIYRDEDFLLNAEELYGPEYAELLAMENLDETLLANYELEREAMGLSDKNREMHSKPKPNGPPRPPRGMFRGRPGPRGRGMVRHKSPVPLMSLGFEGRGRAAPRRMRRGRRPMM